MKRFTVGIAILTLTVPSLGGAQQRYPASKAQPVADNMHGTTLTDPYRWLENDTARDTRAWIDAQNAFRSQLMGNLSARSAVAKRIEEMLRVDVQGAPAVRGNRYFFTKRAADQDLSTIVLREGFTGTDVTLIDPNIMASDVALSVNTVALSEDGSLMAYAIRKGGADEVLVRFYDVNRRRTLPDHLPTARYFGVDITPDNKGIYYTRYDAKGPRLFYRDVGPNAAPPRPIFGEGLGPEKIASGTLSKNGRWLLISVSHGTSGGNDLYLTDLSSNQPPAVMTRGTGKNFSPEFAGERIVIWTDWQAPRGRVMITSTAAPASEQWSTLVPETEHISESASLAGGYVWVNYLENVVGKIRGFDLTGKPFREIAMPALGAISGVGGDFDRDEAYFSFTSYHMPQTTYRYSISKDTREVWWRQGVKFDSDAYEVKQIWYRSKDGTRVPMFIAHKKGLALNGANPTYLTGYGGFYLSSTPGFSTQNAAWLEQGGVLAVPNLRGGGEFGEPWHEGGMFERKQNVFDDFIGAAEFLIAGKYTSPDKLAIAGGSNGGLLVGAALTQRPDLFRAVVCTYPLLDMVRFHKFLVGSYWVSEYGSGDDPKQFPYIKAYSPYHNVKAGTKYPAVFFDTGDSDTRVAPLHARKMTALLQSATASPIGERPVLLRYDTEAGHSGGLPVAQNVALQTERLVFVMWQLGMMRPAM